MCDKTGEWHYASSRTRLRLWIHASMVRPKRVYVGRVVHRYVQYIVWK